jgi:6-pyruvoyl-tetrahydropterin synthase
MPGPRAAWCSILTNLRPSSARTCWNDHASLNDLMQNPTAEHIALWIWDVLSPRIPQLVEIVVWETRTACAVVTSTDARAR